MTPAQLKALMNWIDERLDQMDTDSEDRWKHDNLVDDAEVKLYEAFGFGENDDGDPVEKWPCPPV